MAIIEIGPTRVVIDERDVTKLIYGYTLRAQAGDTPIVVLELRKGLTEQEEAIFHGYANVRIALEEPTPFEFLQAIDPDELAAQVLEEGDADEPPFTTALRLLKEMASGGRS